MTALIDYEVSGRGTFPIDMLRYDVATPFTESDSATIERSFQRGAKGMLTVRVRALRCTEARWESFGWKVLR